MPITLPRLGRKKGEEERPCVHFHAPLARLMRKGERREQKLSPPYTYNPTFFRGGVMEKGFRPGFYGKKVVAFFSLSDESNACLSSRHEFGEFFSFPPPQTKQLSPLLRLCFPPALTFARLSPFQAPRKNLVCTGAFSLILPSRNFRVS